MAATPETIKQVIEHKLRYLKLWDDLIAKYGEDAVNEALEQSGSIHQGCEEIGSSDVNHMVHGMLKSMGEPGLWPGF